MDVDTDYKGNDITHIKNVTSVFACQALCQELDSCAAFGFFTQWNICMMKTAIANIRPIQNLISGPKYC